MNEAEMTELKQTARRQAFGVSLVVSMTINLAFMCYYKHHCAKHKKEGYSQTTAVVVNPATTSTTPPATTTAAIPVVQAVPVVTATPVPTATSVTLTNTKAI